jgi:hypothetical protein
MRSERRRSSTANALALAIWAATCASGCTEVARIQSSPSGARLYVNDELVGITPVEYRVPRWQWPEAFEYRLELEGYLTRRGELGTELHVGRVAGSALTLGIFALFLRPVSLADPQVFSLEAIPRAASAPIPEPAMIDRRDQLDDRLRALQKQLDEGRISPAEYQRRRDAILDER